MERLIRRLSPRTVLHLKSDIYQLQKWRSWKKFEMTKTISLICQKKKKAEYINFPFCPFW